MKHSLLTFGFISLLLGFSRNIQAGCSFDDYSDYCESAITYVGFGAAGSNAFSENAIYVKLNDDPSWFWDQSSAKEKTLATLLSAQSAEQRVQVRWVPGSQGVGSKRITSVLILPN